mmetsp:Transcript_89623/g.159135  ORF Transcript_89623/g.159135 Transcript_89623/m.159135 type:complete len:107 (+) Transcript_89623:164-484(+)
MEAWLTDGKAILESMHAWHWQAMASPCPVVRVHETDAPRVVRVRCCLRGQCAALRLEDDAAYQSSEYAFQERPLALVAEPLPCLSSLELPGADLEDSEAHSQKEPS